MIFLLSIITILFFIIGLLRGSYWFIEEMRVESGIAELEKTLDEKEKIPKEEFEMISKSKISEGKLGLLEKPIEMVKIKCPSCQHITEVIDSGERPLEVVCEKCGAKGDWNKKELRCPKCKKTVMAEVRGKQFKVKCPFCGAEGKIK